MIVSDLINELKALDPNAVVIVNPVPSVGTSFSRLESVGLAKDAEVEGEQKQTYVVLTVDDDSVLMQKGSDDPYWPNGTIT